MRGSSVEGAARGVSVGSGAGRVKKELPDIDWTTPMPPPSPGDDPLLLSRRPRTRGSAARSSSPSLGGGSPTRGDEEEEMLQLNFGEQGMKGLMDVDVDFPPSTDFSDHEGGQEAMPLFDLEEEGASCVGDYDMSVELECGKGLDLAQVKDVEHEPEQDDNSEVSGTFAALRETPEDDDACGQESFSFTHELSVEGEGSSCVGDYDMSVELEEELDLAQGEEGEEHKAKQDNSEVNETSAALPEAPEDNDAWGQVESSSFARELSVEEPEELEEESIDRGEEHEASEDDNSELSRTSAGLPEASEDSDACGQEESSLFTRELSVEEELEELEESIDREEEHEAGDHDNCEVSGTSTALPEGSEANDACGQEGSFSFTRELSEEEELEELEEEQSIDRELSCEPRDDNEEEQDEDRGKSAFETVRTYETHQARSSPSRRWDKPLRPSDFGQSSAGFVRSSRHKRSQAQPQLQLEEELDGADESMVNVEVDGSSSEGEGESVDEGVVTITSNDPLAAARAAAILKLVSRLGLFSIGN